MKLLYVTSEAYPFCKTGGLADVAGSLPPAPIRQDRPPVAGENDLPPVYLRGPGLAA